MRLAALVLAFCSAAAPTWAGPQGCHHEAVQETAQISCAEGKVWDATSESCVTLDS